MKVLSLFQQSNKTTIKGNKVSALHDDWKSNNQVSIMWVTPTLARKWLETNTQNRNLSKLRVNKMVDDILHNRWQFNGESIKFDYNGSLIDGQHRLHAIIQSNVTLSILVVNDLPTTAQQTIDLGRPRTLNDIVSILKIPHASVVAAIANTVLHYNNTPNVIWSERSLCTKAMALDFIQANTTTLIQAALLARSARNGFHIRESVYGAFAFKVQESSNAGMHNFFHQPLVDGTDLSTGDPRLALRNQILRSPYLVNGKWQSQQQLAWTIKAWNSFVVGDPMKRVRFGRDDLPMPTIK